MVIKKNFKKLDLPFNDIFLIFIVLMAFTAISFTFIEPLITKKYVNEEFKTLINKNPSESEYFGKTLDNLIDIKKTQDGSIYRVNYDRWNLRDSLNKHSEPLIISVEEKIGENFVIIHKND